MKIQHEILLSMSWHRFFCYLLICCTSISAGDVVALEPKEGEFTISFLDVGQGSATLISCKNTKEQVLIDAGDSEVRYPGAVTALFRALTLRLYNKHLSVAVATHRDPDHSNGFIALLTNNTSPITTIRSFIDIADTDTLSHEIRQLVLLKKGQYRPLVIGEKRTILSCGTAAVTVFAPSLEETERFNCPEQANDCSIRTTISSPQVTLHLLADKTLLWEKHFLETISQPKSPLSILQIGHHANESTSGELLSKIEPDIAIISAGYPRGVNAHFGYPRKDVLTRLQQYFTQHYGSSEPTIKLSACRWDGEQCRWERLRVSDRIYSTAIHGTIDIQFNAQTVVIVPEKNGIQRTLLPQTTIAPNKLSSPVRDLNKVTFHTR